MPLLNWLTKNELSTYPQKKEPKKEPKKERRKTTTTNAIVTFFYEATG
jgi:hypothetical protein